MLGTLSLQSLARLRAAWLGNSEAWVIEPPDYSNLNRLEKERELFEARRAASAYGASFSTQMRLANVLRSLALGPVDKFETRSALLCQSLSAIGQALKLRPHDSEALAAWANIKQLLSGIECSLPLTSGDYRQALELAQNSDPTNTRVIYASAMISFWSGDTPRCDRLLKQVLEYDLHLSAGQQRFIAARISKSGAPQMIVPARYPQVQRWSEYFKQQLPEDFGALARQFGDLQLEALGRNQAEFDSGTISSELYFNRIMSSLDSFASDEVRRRADSALAGYFSRVADEEKAEYFKLRASMPALQINRAAVFGDSRPEVGNLVLWNNNWLTPLDEFYSSVGFYLAEAQSVRLIELSARTDTTVPEASELQVFGSEDNYNWNQLQAGFTIKNLNIEGTVRRSYIAIDVNSKPFKYWKVHFTLADRRRDFKGPLEALVNAYGPRSK
ncbi:MAG: hypothetical protein K1X83_01400 [Oligoflexia bacterium]|nr:hypothetical protein [Oligoflexia bacterium]